MAECSGLLNRRTGDRSEGSNPSPSATSTTYRDVMKFGIMLDLGSSCRWFESSRPDHMVNVVHLVERQIVALEVMGSKPIIHPKFILLRKGK